MFINIIVNINVKAAFKCFKYLTLVLKIIKYSFITFFILRIYSVYNI
jgi:hypothetical protein